MAIRVQGLHHVTALASSAQANSDFFTKVLGLRRVKKTVNFDAPEVYHLYYGDETGRPGSIMTSFPFPGAARGRPGLGEVGTTIFAVPEGSLSWWSRHLVDADVAGLREEVVLGARRLWFQGPDGEGLALTERAQDDRAPWVAGTVPADHAIRGFAGVHLRLGDGGATEDLLGFMGYAPEAREGATLRMRVPGGNAADEIELETIPGANYARSGAGSVHHIAFSVPDRAAHRDVRAALVDTGYSVTPEIDRDYFWSIYFRSPGGVLFEIATDEPGFSRDEDVAHLGEALKLPRQHEHLRDVLENGRLEPIVD